METTNCYVASSEGLHSIAIRLRSTSLEKIVEKLHVKYVEKFVVYLSQRGFWENGHSHLASRLLRK